MTDTTFVSAPAGGWSREARIAACVTALALAAMAVDHLLGDDPGLEDPPMFAIAAVVTVACAALLFRVVVPRALARPDGGPATALLCSILAVVPGVALLWVGPPFVLAGAGVALGLRARERGPSRRAALAVGLGALVLAAATTAYAVTAVGKLV